MNHFKAHWCCWQNSFSCICMTEGHGFSLAMERLGNRGLWSVCVCWEVSDDSPQDNGDLSPIVTRRWGLQTIWGSLGGDHSPCKLLIRAYFWPTPGFQSGLTGRMNDICNFHFNVLLSLIYYISMNKSFGSSLLSFCIHRWQPTLVFLPGKSHGQRSLEGYSPWGRRVGHDWVTNTHTEQCNLIIKQVESIIRIPVFAF